MNTLDALDAQSLRTDIPRFQPGDTLKVHVKDSATKKTTTLSKTFEVIKPDFGFVRVRLATANDDPTPLERDCQPVGDLHNDVGEDLAPNQACREARAVRAETNQ